MEQRLSMATLGVADLGRAIRFYEDIVGWNATLSPSEIDFFDLGELVFSIFPHSELAKETNQQVDDTHGSGYQGFMLANNVRSNEEVNRTLPA